MNRVIVSLEKHYFLLIFMHNTTPFIKSTVVSSFLMIRHKPYIRIMISFLKVIQDETSSLTILITILEILV